MLTILLSLSFLSMAMLSLISFESSKKVIDNQIKQNMDAELNAQINNIVSKTNDIKTVATQIATNVETTYKTSSLKQYENILKKVIFTNDLVLGSGIWFEPYTYDTGEEYVGPYIYKDGKNAVVTYDYSNKDYNYFGYDWYKNAKNSKEPIFSPLYYDDTLKTTMMTCTVPMYDSTDTFLGVVTVDIEITAIQNLINKLVIGKAGKAILLTQDGLFITNEDSKKVMTTNINKEENKSLSALGQKMLKTDRGTGDIDINKVDYKVYYSNVGDLGWKIMIQIPQKEINEPLNSLAQKLFLVSFLSLLILIGAITLLVNYLTKNIKKVKNFALALAEGEFTTEEIHIKTKDELGQMGEALNKMLHNNKSVIKTITTGSKGIRKNSNGLEETTEILISSFNTIENAIININGDMMNTSAATEEVNASVEEVNASINYLTQETTNSNEMAIAIKERASKVQKRSSASYEQAMALTAENEAKLNQSIEEAKIVESISVMAATISQIAEQVNLLSLNASIEAARAGDQGKGFAVVAKEIGNLASQATATVNEITQTTDKVHYAFRNLTENSKQLLDFLEDRVTPDYQSFVEAGNQYELDAENIQTTATRISNMTGNIEKVISEVADAIQGIAAESENTAANTATIINNMEKVTELAENISRAVSQENMLSNQLDEVVSKFKL
jgi:methyl-accepting chemotaxis protein